MGTKRNLLSLVFLAVLAMPAAAQALTGHLDAQIVVIDNLQPRPVALTDFSVGTGIGHAQTTRSNGDGKISVDLPPGSYTLTNLAPVDFKEKSYTWNKSFDIKRGETTTLMLTQADATYVEKPPEREASSAGKIYKRYKNSVVTVDEDTGHGSGFVVDSKGLILTNYHVAGKSTFLSVRFGPGKRYEAKLVAADQAADVAVIQVNPSAVASSEALPLLAPSESPGVEGDKVVAIGSPLNQEKALTEGIISKVEKDVLISDANINHGNSGGPLLNMAGVVVGITTFGDIATHGGPGLGGIISIRKADAVLAQARSALDQAPLPTLTPLPDVSSTEIPADMLNKVAESLKDDLPFYKAPKNFRTYLSTPFDLVAPNLPARKERDKKIARRYKGKVPPDQASDGPEAFWLKYVGEGHQPLVCVNVLPWPQETSSSSWNHVLWGAAAGRAKLELRDDFARMTLLRDGVEVLPIVRIRDRDTLVYSNYNIEIDDTAMWGAYSYDPRAFAPGAKLELRVWKNDNPAYTKIEIDKEMQEQLWARFKAWAELSDTADKLASSNQRP